MTILETRSKAALSFTKFLNYCSCEIPLNLGKVFLKSLSSKAPGQLLFWGVGVPWYWKILNIWSISESPMNKGLFSIISENIQPRLQMSTPKLYYFYPSKISGALYHKVSTSWVRVLIGIPKALARPKSAILIFPLLSIKTF